MISLAKSQTLVICLVPKSQYLSKVKFTSIFLNLNAIWTSHSSEHRLERSHK